MAKNELTTMYGGGFARLVDSQGRLYRMVNILEATVTFDSKQDFLRAIYPNSPSQVVAVATTENTVTLSVRMGEFTEKYLALASNLEYKLLKEATFPVLNETHIMLTTRTQLRYKPVSESTIRVFVREDGAEKELTRVGGLTYKAKLVRNAASGVTTVYVDDVAGFKVGQVVYLGSEGPLTVSTVEDNKATGEKTVSFTTPLTADHFAEHPGTEVKKAGVTVARIQDDAPAGSVILTLDTVTGLVVGDKIKLGFDAVEYEILTVGAGIATDGSTTMTANQIEIDTALPTDYSGIHAAEYASIGAGTSVINKYEFDVEGGDNIILHPFWVGKGIAVDYERLVNNTGNESAVYQIGGDTTDELGFVDFHLVLQNQQGKWLYFRFPSAIPSGKFTLDMKGSFMNLPNDFTAIAPPGWSKPYIMLGEL